MKESHGSFGYYAENLGPPRHLKMDVQNLQTAFPSASVLNIFVLLSYLYKVENDGFPYNIIVEGRPHDYKILLDSLMRSI